MAKKLIKLSESIEDATISEFEKTDVVEGKPNSIVAIRYENPNNKFYCGVWGSDGGTFKLRYDGDELLCIYEGEVVLTDIEGHSETIRAGEAALIPAGWEGTWETVKPVRKFWAKAVTE